MLPAAVGFRRGRRGLAEESDMGMRTWFGGLLLAAALGLAGCEVLTGEQSLGGPTPFAFPTAYPATLDAATLPPGGSIDGQVWHDLCAIWGQIESGQTPPAGCAEDPRGGYRANGHQDVGEPGIGGVLLRLGQGLCPAAALAEATTDADGRYHFGGLAAGDYCVSLDPVTGANSTILMPGGWTYPLGVDGPTSISVVLPSDEVTLQLSFGWDFERLPVSLGPLPSGTPTATVTPTRTTITTPTATRTSTPGSFPEWKAEYFANQNLSGTPQVVRNEKNLHFDWGSGAPVTGVPANSFSARFSRRLSFSDGKYRFSVIADDGVRLYVDGTRILNEWHESSGDETYTVERDLDGNHTLLVEYYEASGEALLDLSWTKITASPTPTSAPTIGPSNTPSVTTIPTITPTGTDTPLVPSDTPTPTETPIVPSDTPTETETPLVPSETPTPG
jgi:hypothetical protein